MAVWVNRLPSRLQQPEHKTNKLPAFVFIYSFCTFPTFFCVLGKWNVKDFLHFSKRLRSNFEAVRSVCKGVTWYAVCSIAGCQYLCAVFLQRRIPSYSIMLVGIRLHKCIFTQTQRFHDTCISKSDSMYRVYPFLWIERSTEHCKHDSWYVSFHPPVLQKALFNVTALEWRLVARWG